MLFTKFQSLLQNRQLLLKWHLNDLNEGQDSVQGQTSCSPAFKPAGSERQGWAQQQNRRSRVDGDTWLRFDPTHGHCSRQDSHTEVSQEAPRLLNGNPLINKDRKVKRVPLSSRQLEAAC